MHIHNCYKLLRHELLQTFATRGFWYNVILITVGVINIATAFPAKSHFLPYNLCIVSCGNPPELQWICCNIYHCYCIMPCQDAWQILFKIYANLQEFFQIYVKLDFWPDYCKTLKRSCQDPFRELATDKIFHRVPVSCPVILHVYHTQEAKHHDSCARNHRKKFSNIGNVHTTIQY